MLKCRCFPSCQIIRASIIIFAIFCNSPLHAESRVLRSETPSIIPDKSCKESPKTSDIVVVFDGEPEVASSGWFYGKGISPAEFRRIAPSRFEVINPVTRFHKLPPSLMELQSSKDGFNLVVRDYIPEDEKLKESYCFYEKMEAKLVSSKEQSELSKMRAKELFTSEILTLEGNDLLFIQKDYRPAEAKGYRALEILERHYGKASKESLNAVAIIAFALMELERFDEALDIIAPYLKSLPDNAELKEFEKILQKAKKEQDELFSIDPNSKDDIAFDSMG